MKHIKLIVIMTLLVSLVASTAFAAGGANKKAGGVETPQLIQIGQLQKQVVDGELASGKGNGRFVMTPTERPQIKKLSPPTTLGVTVGELSGTYNIPGAWPTGFATINDAIAVLNALGVASPGVTFQLNATTYTELPIVVGGLYTGAGTWPVTITPKAGVAATVNFITTTTNGKGFAFTGAKNFTIDGVNAGGTSLTLKYATGFPFPVSDAFAATVYVTKGSNGVTVKNTNIQGNIDGAWASQTDGRPAVFVWRGASDAAGNSNITIDNCTITHATYALKVTTTSTTLTNGPMWYTNNKVGGAYGDPVCHGGLIDYTVGMHYDYNVLDGIEFVPYYWETGGTEYDLTAYWGAGSGGFLLNFGQHSAGHFYGLGAGSTIAYNYVKDVHQNYNDPGWPFVVYGFVVRLTSSPIVHDNRVTNITTQDVDGAMSGIRFENPFYHNSVRFTGTMLATQVSRCLQPGGVMQNNAASNEMTGGTAANTVASSSPSSTSNNNALYSTGRYVAGYAALATYLATGKDANSVFGPVNFTSDLHINIAGPSSAENIGDSTIGALFPNDIDSPPDVRGAKPDAGADEFGNTGNLIAIDVLPVTILVPAADGNPVGVAQTPVVSVKNNSNQNSGAFNLTLTKTGLGAEAYTDTKVGITLLPMETKLCTMGIAWTPIIPYGARTFTAVTSLADADIPNNTLAQNKNVPAPIIIAATYNECFDGTVVGWTGTGDFSIGPQSAFTKLGGPYAGKTWVTKTTGHYTTGRVLNAVVSPFFDISSFSGDNVWVSFVHSLAVEPNWDRCMMQYTTDNVTWTRMGILNDPDGVNWYKQSVYQWAETDTVNFDIVGAGVAGYPFNEVGSNPGWTSNGDPAGDDVHTGPNGYVFVQLQVKGLSAAQKGFIRFRYLTFSDNSGTSGRLDDGWAFDCFRLANTGASFTGGIIDGKVFLDLNGNGINDDLSPNVGDTVMISYFGIPKDTVLTGADGSYAFDLSVINSGLPGVYNVTLVKPGYAFTVPFGMSSTVNINHPGNGSTITQNFGKYQGSISGIKFNDLNDDSLYNTDVDTVGVSGWTIEVHKDSANGPFVGSAITGADGEYSILVPAYYWGGTHPGNYVVKEIPQPTNGRQTYPWNPSKNYTVTVTGAMNSPSSVITGINFGNFIFANILCEVVQDRNGNGVRDLPDGVPLPLLSDRVYIDVFKNRVKIGTDTLGDGVGSKLHRTLDKGIYGFKRVSAVPTGHVETAPASINPPSPADLLDSITVFVTQCATVDTASFLYFKLVSVTGLKFEDKDNSGSLTAGDVGADGWTINIDGAIYGSATAVTHDGGNYMLTDVGPGSHTVSETILSPDWAQTFPAPPGTYTFTPLTASQGGNQVNKNFGNFKKFCVSGIKFRDRNADGDQDEGEEPLAGWTMNLTGQTPIVTGADGKFEWCGLVRGSYTLSETPQTGWIPSTPPGGTITFNGISGDTIIILFGNSGPVENTKYRTFTYEQLRDCSVPANNQKVLKAPSIKAPAAAPWYPIPLMTLVNKLVAPLTKGGEGAVLLVGERNKIYPWGKIAAWLEPAAYGDVSKTFVDCKKSVVHTGASQPFNITGTSIMTKRYKSIPPGPKNNNKLIAELLTLQVNLALSDKGHTPTGLGALIYTTPGPWGSNVAIDSLEAYANKIMTNWYPGMVTPSPANPADYDALYTAVRAINLAFASISAVDTTVDGGWRGPKFKYMAYTAASEISFIHVNPSAVPKARPVGTPEVIPDVYALGQNYPNPFNPTTTLSFDLPSDAVVTLKIYNLLGQEVTTVLDRQEYSAGTYEESFDASQLASGVYLYRIIVEQIGDDGSTGKSFTQVKKMVLTK